MSELWRSPVPEQRGLLNIRGDCKVGRLLKVGGASDSEGARLAGGLVRCATAPPTLVAV